MSHFSGEIFFVDAGIKVWDGLDAVYTEKAKHWEVVTFFNPSIATYKGVRYVSFRKATGFFHKASDGSKGRQYDFTSVIALGTIKADGTLSEVVELKGNHPIEDIRLFARDDGLYGVGTVWGFKDVNIGLKVGLCRIDPAKKSYEVIEQFESPVDNKRIEKNWSPPAKATPWFDYTYSMTATIRGNEFLSLLDNNDFSIRGGTPLLEFSDGRWVSIRHIVKLVKTDKKGGNIKKFYASVACIHSAQGYVTEVSEPFHMGSGERNGWYKAGRTEAPKTNEFIEYVCGAEWHEQDKSLFITLGIVDELCGYGVVNLEDLWFHPYSPGDLYYNLSVDPATLSSAVK